jgi:hypothetical protein
VSSPFQLLAQDEYSQNPQEGKKNPYSNPFEQLQAESNPINQFFEENLFSKDKSPFEQGLQSVIETAGKIPGFRQAAQVPLGIAEGTGYGIATNLLNLIGTGEAMSPDTIDELRIAHERQGLLFDEEKYLEAVGRVSETFPTVSNIARMTEEETGLPLEAKSRLDKFINFTSMATKLAPKPGTFIGMNTALQKPVLGTGVGLTKEVLDEIGLPEPLSELASFFILKKPTAGAGSFSIGTKGKPSGMPKRGFEKLTEPTEVPAKKIQQISDKLENDFRSSADQIIKDSPIGETAENLKNDPRYKNESRELLNQAQIMADKTPGTLPTMEYKKALLQQSQKQIKGFALNEYKKNYLKFMKEAVENVLPENMTYGELVEQYRENNRGLGEYFEPGSSKALNRAKKDALLDQNRAIASVLEENNPELSKVFKEGNERWTKIMDAETIDNFVSDMFPEGKKVDFKHMKDLFDDPNYQRIFKRSLGEEGAKAFELAVEDMLTAERPYKMMREAREKGFGDLAVSAKAYLVNPKLGYVKAGIDAARAAYRGLFNFTLDKPQIGINFTKAVQDLKKGDFKAAEQGFKTVQAELEATPKQAKAEPSKAARNETVEVKPTEVKAAPEAEQKKAANVAKFNEKKKNPEPKSAIKDDLENALDKLKKIRDDIKGNSDEAIKSRSPYTKQINEIELMLHERAKESKKKSAQPKKQIEYKPKNEEPLEEKTKFSITHKSKERGQRGKIEVFNRENKTIAGLDYSKDPQGIFISNIFSNQSGGAKAALKEFFDKFINEDIWITPMTEKGAKFFEQELGHRIEPRIIKGEHISDTLKRPRIDYKLTDVDKAKILRKEKPSTPTKPKEARGEQRQIEHKPKIEEKDYNKAIEDLDKKIIEYENKGGDYTNTLIKDLPKDIQNDLSKIEKINIDLGNEFIEKIKSIIPKEIINEVLESLGITKHTLFPYSKILEIKKEFSNPIKSKRIIEELSLKLLPKESLKTIDNIDEIAQYYPQIVHKAVKIFEDLSKVLGAEKLKPKIKEIAEVKSKLTPKEKLIKEMKSGSAPTSAEQSKKNDWIQDQLKKYPKEEIEWIYREAYPHATEKAMDLMLAKHGIHPKGKAKPKYQNKSLKNPAESLSETKVNEIKRQDISKAGLKKQKHSVEWTLHKESKKPFATSTNAQSNMIEALIEPGDTFKDVYKKINYDPEAKAIVKEFIDSGYGDIPIELNEHGGIKPFEKINPNKKKKS